MRKIIIAAAIVCGIYIYGCTGVSTNADAQTQKNIDAVNAVDNAIRTGDVSKLGDYMAEDCVDSSGGEAVIKGIDAFKKMLGAIHSQSKDMKMDVVKTLADNEYVFQWVHLYGTSDDASMGMPAGTKYDFTPIEVSKFTNGKVSQHWEFMTVAEMMKMMANMPSSTATDTTKTK